MQPVSSVCCSVFHFQFCYNFGTELSIVGWPSGQTPYADLTSVNRNTFFFFSFVVFKKSTVFICKWNGNTIKCISNHSTIFLCQFFLLTLNSGDWLGSFHWRSCRRRTKGAAVEPGLWLALSPRALTDSQEEKANRRGASLPRRRGVCSSQGLSWATCGKSEQSGQTPSYPPTHISCHSTGGLKSRAKKCPCIWITCNKLLGGAATIIPLRPKWIPCISWGLKKKKNILLAHCCQSLNATKMLTCVRATDWSNGRTHLV